MASRPQIEAVATAIVDSAFRVHRELGPGLLESAYQASLIHELSKRGHLVRTEVRLPLHFEGLELEAAYRVDVLLDDVILIENKTVRALTPVHRAQVLTYLRLADLKLGFLINWNVVLIKDGIKRVVNRLPEVLDEKNQLLDRKDAK